MLEAIRAGTILIRDGAVLPEALQYKSESYLPGWGPVQGSSVWRFSRRGISQPRRQNSSGSCKYSNCRRWVPRIGF
jgi:hypothetical protein